MHSLPTKLVQVGASTAMVIPAAVARLFGYRPGTRVNACFAAGEAAVSRPVISMSGGRSVGVIVPKASLQALGWARGDVVDVPFSAWSRAEDGTYPPPGEGVFHPPPPPSSPMRKAKDDTSRHADVGNAERKDPAFPNLTKMEEMNRRMHVERAVEMGLSPEEAERHADDDAKHWSPADVEKDPHKD